MKREDAHPTKQEETVMGAPVVHFEVVGKDGMALNAFYSQLFDWTIDSNNPIGYGGGIMGAMQGMEDYPGHVTFYVEVPDVEAALKQAESLGGTRRMGPDEVPGGPVLGQFVDPEAHLIGLVQAAS